MTTCSGCGFRAPENAAIPGEIATIPARWKPVLIPAAAPHLVGAARLRDELHVVANRVSRLRVAPGSDVLVTVSTDAQALDRIANGEHVLALLSVSAKRLANLTASLEPGEWSIRGRVGAGDISIAELALMPLHRSHARLIREATCR